MKRLSASIATSHATSLRSIHVKTASQICVLSSERASRVEDVGIVGADEPSVLAVLASEFLTDPVDAAAATKVG
jgi:hypothetical protein